jgi:hypothetical protein
LSLSQGGCVENDVRCAKNYVNGCAGSKLHIDGLRIGTPSASASSVTRIAADIAACTAFADDLYGVIRIIPIQRYRP